MSTIDIKPLNIKETANRGRWGGLWHLMSGYRLIYLGANLTVGLAALMKTSTYFLIGYLIDDLLGKGQYEWLPLAAFGFIALAFLEGGFTFASGWLAALAAESITIRLRDYLFDHLQKLRFNYHDRTRTGELVQRVTSDVEAVGSFFRSQGIGFGRTLLLFTINFAAIMRINVQLAWLSVIAIPFIVGISFIFFKRISDRYEAFQGQEGKMSAALQENLSGVRVVKAFARQEFEKDKFDHESRETFDRGRELLLMHTFFWPISDIIAGAQMLGGFFAGAWFAIQGIISPGDYIAYAGMIIWIIWPMRNLGRLIVQTSTALVSFERVAKIIAEDREPLQEDESLPAATINGAITFEQLSFAYNEQGAVLHDINLTVKPGEIIAILGGTGAGKSSLLGLLPRFYDYQTGRILLDGIDLQKYDRHTLRQQIGIVEQEPFLFSRSIRENICYGVSRPVTDEEVERVARIAAIHEVITTFPDGYKTLVGERGVTLSGGQKQRLAIARTLLKDPRILILDDATSSVDTETEAAIRGALAQLMAGRTTFIIAHRIESVMDADQIIVLEQGRIIQHGNHQQLVQQSGFYQEIYQLQSQIEDELQQELAAYTAAVPDSTAVRGS